MEVPPGSDMIPVDVAEDDVVHILGWVEEGLWAGLGIVTMTLTVTVLETCRTVGVDDYGLAFGDVLLLSGGVAG